MTKYQGVPLKLMTRAQLIQALKISQDMTTALYDECADRVNYMHPRLVDGWKKNIASAMEPT